MKLSWVAQNIGASLHGGDGDFSQLSTDSRAIVSGDLFVALRGESFNGHDYLLDVAERGACAVVVEQLQPELKVPQLIVDDTTRALGDISRLARERFEGLVIGLTGSSGKTTVKNMLNAILSRLGETLATAGNFNNHIGVPLTLLRLLNQKYAIVEAGTSGKGEIHYLTQLINPHIALLNNVMPAHVEGFGSVAAIAVEKSQIYTGPDLRVGIVNLNDAFCHDFIDCLQGKQIIGFAMPSQDSNEPVQTRVEVDRLVVANNIEMQASGCCVFQVEYQGEIETVNLKVPGRHSVSNALAAIATALAVDVSLHDIVQGLETYTGTPGRMQITESSQCLCLINDTYNANPGSMIAAIDYLAELGNGVLVMGDMGELGDQAAELHTEVGRHAQQKRLQGLFATGELSRAAVQAFGEGAHWFATKEALIAALQARDLTHNNVLVKGSRFTKMEEVVDQLANNNKEVVPC